MVARAKAGAQHLAQEVTEAEQQAAGVNKAKQLKVVVVVPKASKTILPNGQPTMLSRPLNSREGSNLQREQRLLVESKRTTRRNGKSEYLFSPIEGPLRVMSSD